MKFTLSYFLAFTGTGKFEVQSKTAIDNRMQPAGEPL
jgi:hypothetical protein